MTAIPSLGVLGAWAPVTTPVDVYAASRDPAGLLIRFTLFRAGVAHRCVDVAANPEAAPALAGLADRGRDRLPVVSVDGEWLARPTVAELEDALRRHHLA